MSDNPINLVTGVVRDQVSTKSPIIHDITFCPQHHRVRGRVCDAAGAVAVAAGAGAHQVGGRLHQLVPPHEDQAHNHRPLPRG